jgi:hypothetical protein
MVDTTQLFNNWIGENVIAYVLRPGGPPTGISPEGEPGPIGYPLGVGTNGGVLKGFDERGIIVDSGNPMEGVEEIHFIPWSAILDLKIMK